MADPIQSWIISGEVCRDRSLKVVIGLILAGIEEKSLAIKKVRGVFRWAREDLLKIQKRGSGVCVCACVCVCVCVCVCSLIGKCLCTVDISIFALAPL